MTGKQILRLCYDIMGTTEADETDFEPNVPGILNVLLGELFHVNNNLRQSKELPVLTEIPQIETLQDEITYEQEIQLTVMPYGIAEKYAAYDDNTVNIGYYNSLYVNGVNYCTRGIPQENGVIDLY